MSNGFVYSLRVQPPKKYIYIYTPNLTCPRPTCLHWPQNADLAFSGPRATEKYGRAFLGLHPHGFAKPVHPGAALCRLIPERTLISGSMKSHFQHCPLNSSICCFCLFPLLILKGIYHYWTYAKNQGLEQMDVNCSLKGNYPAKAMLRTSPAGHSEGLSDFEPAPMPGPM